MLPQRAAAAWSKLRRTPFRRRRRRWTGALLPGAAIPGRIASNTLSRCGSCVPAARQATGLSGLGRSVAALDNAPRSDCCRRRTGHETGLRPIIESFGFPCCSIRPWFMTTMRSDMVIAVLIVVTKTKVVRICRWVRFSGIAASAGAGWHRAPPVAHPANDLGSQTMARANATRCFCRPKAALDSDRARGQPTISSVSSTSSLARAGSRRCTRDHSRRSAPRS